MADPVPEGFSRESFSGFDLTDDEVGSGPYRDVAIELKHVFEGLVVDADEKNEEFFLDVGTEQALTAFVQRPSHFSLGALLAVCPSLYPGIAEIMRLVSPSLLGKLPLIV